MASYRISDDEIQALYGLPYMAQALYMYLRRRMDFGSGYVGRRLMVSWWALREDLNVESAQGRRAESSGVPSEKAVRYASKCLERAGLLRPVSEARRLVFFLPMAELAEVRPVEVGQTRGRPGAGEVGQSKHQQQSGFADEVGQTRGRPGAGEVGHTSGIRYPEEHRQSSRRAEYTASARVDGDDDLSGIDDPPTDPWQWLLVFNRRYGCEYNPSSIHDRKGLWPMFRRWCESGVTLERLDAAVKRAWETATGPILNLPGYVDRVLASDETRFGKKVDSAKAELVAGLTGRVDLGGEEDGRIIDADSRIVD